MRAITLASNVPAAGPALAPSSTGTLQFPPVLWRSYQGLSDLLPGGWRGGREAAAQPPGGPPARAPPPGAKGRAVFPAGCRRGSRVPPSPPARLRSSPWGTLFLRFQPEGLGGECSRRGPPPHTGRRGRCVRTCRVVAARPQGPSRTRVPSPRLHVAHDSRGSAAARSKPALPRAGVCVGGGV